MMLHFQNTEYITSYIAEDASAKVTMKQQELNKLTLSIYK